MNVESSALLPWMMLLFTAFECFEWIVSVKQWSIVVTTESFQSLNMWKLYKPFSIIHCSNEQWKLELQASGNGPCVTCAFHTDCDQINLSPQILSRQNVNLFRLTIDLIKEKKWNPNDDFGGRKKKTNEKERRANKRNVKSDLRC